MTESYKLSLGVKEDLRRIYRYGFNNWREEQADKHYFSFFECFDLIAEKPYIKRSESIYTEAASTLRCMVFLA